VSVENLRHDRVWITRKKGAYIGLGVDTAKVVAARVNRHVTRMAQRVPPALYR